MHLPKVFKSNSFIYSDLNSSHSAYTVINCVTARKHQSLCDHDTKSYVYLSIYTVVKRANKIHENI